MVVELAQEFRATIVYVDETETGNEMVVEFPSNTNKMEEFVKVLNRLYGDNKDYCWVAETGDELMKEYDAVTINWR